MSAFKELTTPLTIEDVEALEAGDLVHLNGVLYTGRDAAHKRMVETLERGEELPIDIEGQVIYFVGPTPARPGRPIGSAGPTTSSRMDPYSPRLMEMGLRGMIGKGNRSQGVRDAMVERKCVYFASVGGAGALVAKRIKKSEVVAYEELGPEAIRRLEVEQFPVIVVNDVHGNDLYEIGVKQYARS